jgi:hypothetical protein
MAINDFDQTRTDCFVGGMRVLNTNFDGSSASEFLYNKEIPKLILTNLD